MAGSACSSAHAPRRAPEGGRAWFAALLLLALVWTLVLAAQRRLNIYAAGADRPGGGGGGGLGGSGGGGFRTEGGGHVPGGGVARQLLQDGEVHPLRGPHPLTEPGRAVLLFTQFGTIRIRLLERLAPRVTALVWDMAAARNCSDSYRCALYRAEARPPADTPLGPPYALLQGRLYDMAADPPFEGNIEVKRGHVCFIPGGRDWFISLGDHPEWETSHPVWGLVEEWSTVDAIVAQNHSVWTSADGIQLRILSIEVPFKMAAEGDHTWGARSAALR